jgi:hypothetical protein
MDESATTKDLIRLIVALLLLTIWSLMTFGHALKEAQGWWADLSFAPMVAALFLLPRVYFRSSRAFALSLSLMAAGAGGFWLWGMVAPDFEPQTLLQRVGIAGVGFVFSLGFLSLMRSSRSFKQERVQWYEWVAIACLLVLGLGFGIWTLVQEGVL